MTLPPLLVLDSPVRSYDWGSRTFLARLRGAEVPSPQPEAELWIGAHPTAPSRVKNDGSVVALDSLIAERPDELVGRAYAQRHGAILPFLLKVLGLAAG